MVLTKPCIFKISVLCQHAVWVGWVGSGVENDNSTKIGKEETNLMVTVW